MPDAVKSLLNATVFIIFAALVFIGISSMTVGRKYMNTWIGVVTENPLYAAPKNSIDVASFGASSGMTSFSPLELWEEYGISAYNYSSEQQSPIISYNYLKEVLKNQDIKVVLLNTQMMISNWNEGLQRKAFDRINLSYDKYEGAKDFVKMRDFDSLFSYIVPIYKFHTRWKSLNKYDFLYDIPHVPNSKYSIHNGYIKGYGNQSVSKGWTGLTDTGSASLQLLFDANWYYNKLIRLCQSKDIAVVLYSQVFDRNPARHNAIQTFANSLGVPFIDFHMQNTITVSGIDLNTDIGAHQSTSGGIKGSRYLGKYLNDNYDLPDHRGDPDYDWLNSNLEDYKRSLWEMSLLETRNLSEYLDLLQQSNYLGYTVFFSVKDEATKGLNDDVKNKLQQFGFRTDFTGKYRNSFLAVWQDGNVVYERVSDGANNESDALEFRGTLPCKLKYYLKSAGYLCGNISSIIIDGQQYSKNGRGFNVVVYDNIMKRVVDSVYWDTCANAGIESKR